MEVKDPDDWAPFEDLNAFEMTEYYYKSGFSAGEIDESVRLWACRLEEHGGVPPFSNHKEMYETIDTIELGNVPWQSFAFNYQGPELAGPDAPKWMTTEYTVWYRDPRQLFVNMLKNSDFSKSFDHAPFRQYDKNGNRCYENFMSGNWAWKQAVSGILSLLLASILLSSV